MLFRISNQEYDKNFRGIGGVYVHGKAEDKMGYDCVEIANADTRHFAMLAEKGIGGVKVTLEGYGDALLFAWKSELGMPMVANPPFEMLHFRGLIVDPEDTESVEYARQAFKERKQVL